MRRSQMKQEKFSVIFSSQIFLGAVAPRVLWLWRPDSEACFIDSSCYPGVDRNLLSFILFIDGTIQCCSRLCFLKWQKSLKWPPETHRFIAFLREDLRGWRRVITHPLLKNEDLILLLAVNIFLAIGLFQCILFSFGE